jgi:hypothetical protein
MLSFFKSQSVTLLAREVRFDSSNPSNPILIEGDQKGFLIWILKRLNLMDPSFRVEVKDGNLITCAGNKNFSYMPMSLLSSYSAGFSTQKAYVVAAILLAIVAIGSFFVSMDLGVFGLILSVLYAGISYLLMWLYRRSGALTFQMNLYNREGGVTIRIQSGLTGIKLDKELLDKAIDAAAVAAKGSTHFK